MQRAFISLLPLATLSCLIPFTAQAQVTPDGTTSTTVNQDGNNFTINQGNRVGDNLFHSFNEFSVPTLGSAVFNNAGDIANIFSRVTGSNISNIDGLIGANGAANLFLINPNGIIFGQNASLNLGGSFFASTADSLLFEGDAEFSAVNPQAPPLLEVSIPIGASFRDNPGEITVQSISTPDAAFFVPTGETLALIGGNVSLEAGEIFALGGTVELGGLAAVGTVTLNDDFSLSFPEGVTRADVFLNNGAVVDVSSGGGGNININARNLELSQSNLFAGIRPNFGNPQAQAGDITINATESVNLKVLGNILNRVDFGAVGDAGNIDITTNNLSLETGSNISASTFGIGNGGNISINATESVNLRSASLIGNIVNSEAQGDAGNINITTSTLNLSGGISINTSTRGMGNAGDININTSELVSVDFESLIFNTVQETAFGNAGETNINTKSLSVTDGSSINNSTFGIGNGGNITVNTTESIDISENSRISNDVNANATGNAGITNIETSRLSLNNRGQISSVSNGNGNAGDISINASELININANGFADNTIVSQLGLEGTGNAGDIIIRTTNLSLNNGGQIVARTLGNGNAGNISINASESVSIDGSGNDVFIGNFSSNILSNVGLEAIGNAGILQINTKYLSLTNSGQINAITDGNGNAGNIVINASESVSIDGVNEEGFSSLITNQSQPEDFVNGGIIDVVTNSLSLTNGGRIITSIFGNGNAGNILINASESILIDTESAIFNTVGIGSMGNGGEIVLNTANLNIANSGQINIQTLGEGNGGILRINASESVNLLNNGAIFSTVEEEAIGNGGNIFIDTNNLTLNQGVIDTSPRGQGNGGNVSINVLDSITLDNISLIVTFPDNIENLGNGGEFDIIASNLEINGRSQINTSSFAEGNAGRISIKVDNLSLDNGFISSARVPSESVTNNENLETNIINLEIADNVILRNNSRISAQARRNVNGGNLSINANFIVAFPNQNNDIIANAQQGNGGNIDITTQAIFGLEERFSTPPNQTNDIDASSEFGLQGSFSLNTPDVDPTSGLIELPASVGDASDQISQNPCEKGVGSEFIITGKGGFPANPHETLNSDEVRVDLVEPLPQPLSYEERGEKRGDEATGKQREEDNHKSTVSEQLVPAMGWVFNDKGQVTLTAYNPTGNGQQRFQPTKTSCSADPKEN
jgi:filamentous hemagglutinin family protein